MNRIPLTLLAIAILLSACNVDNDKPVTVVVFAGGEHCAVKEQATACKDVPKYLRDTLKIPVGRQINVSMDHIEKGDVNVDHVAESIKLLGFTDVRAWHFGL